MIISSNQYVEGGGIKATLVEPDARFNLGEISIRLGMGMYAYLDVSTAEHLIEELTAALAKLREESA